MRVWFYMYDLFSNLLGNIIYREASSMPVFHSTTLYID